MICNWSRWKRFPNLERGEHVEAPIGSGIYEVRSISTGDLVAFEASSNVAQALAVLARGSTPGRWAKMFGNGRNAQQSNDLEYRTCPASSLREARTMVNALVGRRQVYWRRTASQTNFAGSI